MYDDFVRQRIAFLRTNKKISARELSLRVGQSEGYINSIENGRTNPSLPMLFSICDELNISISDFFDEGTRHPDIIKEIIPELKRMDKNSLESLLSFLKATNRQIRK